jgi:hypothetical protein
LDDQQGPSFERRPEMPSKADRGRKIITEENYQEYLDWVAGGRQGPF